MTLKVYVIVICWVCWLAASRAQANESNKSKTTNLTIHWHFENEDELINITRSIQELKTENENLHRRLEQMEEINKRFNLQDSCTNTLMNGIPSGVFNIRSSKNLHPFPVYCLSDADVNRPWTIIQRREDGSVDFSRNWTDYVNGFGNTSGEYWLGVQRIHELTSAQPMELWVKWVNCNGETHSANYSLFVVGGKREVYELADLGDVVGDANILKSYQKFSIRDGDNNPCRDDTKCAAKFKNAWWFIPNSVTWNLNGKYDRNAQGEGVVWSNAKDFYNLCLYKYVHMAIRPRTE